MWNLCLLLLVSPLLASAGVIPDEKEHFDGYSVIRAVPTNSEGLQLLLDLAEDENVKVDFWMEPTQENRPVDMMVSPELKEALTERLQESRVPFTVLIDDVESAVQEENSVVDGSARRANSNFFVQYQRLSNIHTFLDSLVSSNPSIVSAFSIGKSTEGRDLKAIKISSGNGGKKPAIWIDGGIHAREWISPATVLYIANQLVSTYGTNSEVKKLVDTFDWYILPVTNPDGYEYTHTNNRMWRKTRSRSSALCVGVDANRNFGYKWNTGGASSSACSDTFAGSRAFSEPETKALSDFVLAHKDDIKIFLNVHSYSQLWLTPWGFSSALPKDYADMKAAADVSVSALTKVHGTQYRVGTSTNILYVASGISIDWAYGSAGIKHSYTLELRDTGRYGFTLPANQIVPSGQETWESVKALANYVASNEL